MSTGDTAALNRILKLARALESAWPESGARRDLSADATYLELRRTIAECANAEAPELRRLGGSAAHLHDEVNLTHFYTFIVPFERFASRTLRDDEFLVSAHDGLQSPAPRVPLKVIVENMRSAFNVGALFRTAEGLGISEILLCGYTPDPTDEKIARTAMGTAALVPWRRADRARTACEELRSEGYAIVALETARTAISLRDYKFDGPTAFVLGNERFGLEGDTLHAVDALCRISLTGVKNSLNVGVAFGIAAFEWRRQRA